MTQQTLLSPPAATAPGMSGPSTRIWLVAAIVIAALGTGLATATMLPAPMAVTAGLTVFCIGLWATVALPEYWTALAFMLAAVVLNATPATTVFSGFASSTFWFLFAGLVLGAAISHTGLGHHGALLLARMLGRRYSSIIAGIVAFGVLLAFVMPSSMGRIVLLVPIVAALADSMGYGPSSKGRTGMLMAAAFGTNLPAYAILPANAPNMMLAGMSETLLGQSIGYWDYLLLHFPVLGILKAAVLAGLILWMFPERDPPHAPAPERPLPKLRGSQLRLAVLLGLCLVLWLTDQIHHISPAWIGMAAALCCLWPGSGLTGERSISRDINYGSLFFVAGVMGLGAVIAETGLGAAMVHALSDYAGFATGRPVWNVAALTGLATIVGTVTNLPGVPAILTPMTPELAAATGLPVGTVLMTQVLAFSNVLLPYQAPPLIMAMQLAGLPARTVVRLCLLLFAISTLMLIPLDLLWWHMLGLF